MGQRPVEMMRVSEAPAASAIHSLARLERHRPAWQAASVTHRALLLFSPAIDKHSLDT